MGGSKTFLSENVRKILIKSRWRKNILVSQYQLEGQLFPRLEQKGKINNGHNTNTLSTDGGSEFLLGALLGRQVSFLS